MAGSATIASGADRLARAVLAQAEEEAARIRQAAVAEAGRWIAEAEAEAAERSEAAARAQSAKALRSQVAGLALARLDARRQLLETREKLIERVFVRTGEGLQSLRARPEYASVLRRLVREGVEALGGEGFVVEVGTEDLAVAEEFAASIATQNLAVEVQARQEIAGGCVVWTRDRRAFYENTFASILSRNKPRLRALVAEWLWGDRAGADGDLGRSST